MKELIKKIVEKNDKSIAKQAQEFLTEQAAILSRGIRKDEHELVTAKTKFDLDIEVVDEDIAKATKAVAEAYSDFNASTTSGTYWGNIASKQAMLDSLIAGKAKIKEDYEKEVKAIQAQIDRNRKHLDIIK